MQSVVDQKVAMPCCDVQMTCSEQVPFYLFFRVLLFWKYDFFFNFAVVNRTAS